MIYLKEEMLSDEQSSSDSGCNAKVSKSNITINRHQRIIDVEVSDSEMETDCPISRQTKVKLASRPIKTTYDKTNTDSIVRETSENDSADDFQPRTKTRIPPSKNRLALRKSSVQTKQKRRGDKKANTEERRRS